MSEQSKKEIINVLAGIKDPKLMSDFLDDLLTPAEMDDIVVRWQIVKQLAAGVPQRQISKSLGVSIAKVTRGSREMRNPKGGFRRVLHSIKKETA